MCKPIGTIASALQSSDPSLSTADAQTAACEGELLYKQDQLGMCNGKCKRNCAKVADPFNPGSQISRCELQNRAFLDILPLDTACKAIHCQWIPGALSFVPGVSIFDGHCTTMQACGASSSSAAPANSTASSASSKKKLKIYIETTQLTVNGATVQKSVCVAEKEPQRADATPYDTFTECSFRLYTSV